MNGGIFASANKNISNCCLVEKAAFSTKGRQSPSMPKIFEMPPPLGCPTPQPKKKIPVPLSVMSPCPSTDRGPSVGKNVSLITFNHL